MQYVNSVEYANNVLAIIRWHTSFATKDMFGMACCYTTHTIYAVYTMFTAFKVLMKSKSTLFTLLVHITSLWVNN